MVFPSERCLGVTGHFSQSAEFSAALLLSIFLDTKPGPDPTQDSVSYLISVIKVFLFKLVRVDALVCKEAP